MQEILSRVARLLGARVLSHRTVQGGYTPALRLVCETSKGSFFVTTPSPEGESFYGLTDAVLPHSDSENVERSI